MSQGLAEFCLFSGDVPGYRSARAVMLDRFQTSDSPAIIQNIALMSLLLPSTGEDRTDVTRGGELADQALSQNTPMGDDYASYVFTKSLADYRRGDFDAAIRAATGDGSRIMGPCPRLITAMSLKGQGNHSAAENELAAAAARFDWRTETANKRDFWIYHILFREAQSKIVPDVEALMKGSRHPVNNSERTILIAACQTSRLNRRCVQAFRDALAIEPEFIEKRRPNPRFIAACASSALSLCRDEGRGSSSDGPEFDGLREDALLWLNAAMKFQLKYPPMSATGRVWLSGEFATWRRDPGLTDCRDPVRLQSLRPDFSEKCAVFWASVEEGITRLRGTK